MKQFKKISGNIVTEGISLVDLSYDTDQKGHYQVVYHPDFNGKPRVFKAKRRGDDVVLYEYNYKMEMGVENISNLKKLVFVKPGTNIKHDLRWTQWQKRIDEGEVDTNVPVKVIIEDKIARIVPQKIKPITDILVTLCKGGKDINEVAGKIRSAGYELRPINSNEQHAY